MANCAVDLASQVVISISEHLMQQKSDHYPVGRSRLEALGVIACASIMSMASVEVRSLSLVLYSANIEVHLLSALLVMLTWA